MQPPCYFYPPLLLAIGVLLFLLQNHHVVPEAHIPNLVLMESAIIAPDLNQVDSFRTSQLMYIKERPVLSRKVHFRFDGAKSPKFIIVLGLNSDLDQATLKVMLDDKLNYARKDGYGMFCCYLQDTAPAGVPHADALGVAKLGLMRQALEAFPDATWLWNVDANSIITNVNVPVSELVSSNSLHKNALRSHSICDEQPHVKTFEHANVRLAKFVFASNKKGLVTDWFFVRNSLEGKVLLEFGSDPLNQQFGDFHRDPQSPSLMMTHIIVWHPRFLSHTAVIDPDHISRYEWQHNDFMYFGDVHIGLKLRDMNYIY